MSASFFTHLVNGSFGDPALYVRLAHQSEAILFDCGDLHPLTPRACLKVRTIFVSHAHIDHLVGFDSLLRLSLYRDVRLRLFGPPGMVDIIDSRLGGYTWNLMDGFPLELEVVEWSATEGRCARFRAGRGFVREDLPPLDQREGWLWQTPLFRVKAVPLDHGGIDSLAYLLQERQHVAIHRNALDGAGYLTGPWLTRFKTLMMTEADPLTKVEVPRKTGGNDLRPLGELAAEIAHVEPGVGLCYVTDVKPTAENLEKIVALARGACLLAIEAPFLHAELERAISRNHLTARLAGEAAGWAGVGRLLVFHHSPRYQDRPLELWREAEKARRSVAVGRKRSSGECPSFSLC